MHDRLNVEAFLLFSGGVMIIYAVYGVCTGELPGRNGADCYRVDKPKRFWIGIAAYFALGIGFLARFLQLAHSAVN